MQRLSLKRLYGIISKIPELQEYFTLFEVDYAVIKLSIQ